jgi:hypothetical protein
LVSVCERSYMGSQDESTAHQGQSTVCVHWPIVPSRQILHVLYALAFDCVIRVWRTDSQLAASCPSSCLAKSFVDTGDSHLNVVILLNIQNQTFKSPLTRFCVKLLILVGSLFQYPIPILFSPVTYLRWSPVGFIGLRTSNPPLLKAWMYQLPERR